MTRAQFLNDLYHHLYGLTREQAEQHLTYYAEMLADRMEEGMGEEEAVAGLEDVETIARRILEEEGLPYTPPEERPPVPPACPDPPRRDAMGDRGYQVPRGWNWRRFAQIALWAAAAVSVVFAVGRWRNSQLRAHEPQITHAEAADRVIQAVEFATPVYEGYAYEYEDYINVPYEAGYACDESGPLWFDPSEVERVEIYWTAGTVLVQGWAEGLIQVREYAAAPLSGRTGMSCREEDGTLAVRYRESGGTGTVKDSKWLTVLVPEGLLAELEITTTSADVILYGLELAALTVCTTSGDVVSGDCYVRKAELGAASGDVTLDSFHADEAELSSTSGCISGDAVCVSLEAETVSGDVDLSALGELESAELRTTSGTVFLSVENPAAREIDVTSVSGDVNLSLPWGMGFTLAHATVSGDLETSYFDAARPNGRYAVGGGDCEIEVETVSGDVYLH